MAGNPANKGNPASKRIGNPKRKARREASWARSQARKRKNREENEARAARNRELRAQGLPTPVELAQKARRERRDQLRAEGKLPPIGTPRDVWEAQQKRKAKV